MSEPSVSTLFDVAAIVADHEPNPCIALYGYGPQGEQCKTCALLFTHHVGSKYHKCSLRRFSHSEATDHRVRWSACGKWEAKGEYDPECGLTIAEWQKCAQWVVDHPRAASWAIKRTREINDEENRPASWRQDIEPKMAENARKWGLDKGVYPGVDHRMSAPLARYLAITRKLWYRLRPRAGDNVKNATPVVGVHRYTCEACGQTPVAHDFDVCPACVAKAGESASSIDRPQVPNATPEVVAR